MDVMVERSIKLNDSLFDPEGSSKKIHYYKGNDGKPRYKLWIFLDGRDLYYVDYIVYKLHSTFPDPVKKVKRTISNPNCSMVIWTWGIFTVEAEIYLKGGERIRTKHYLTYDRQINDSAEYVETTN